MHKSRMLMLIDMSCARKVIALASSVFIRNCKGRMGKCGREDESRATLFLKEMFLISLQEKKGRGVMRFESL